VLLRFNLWLVKGDDPAKTLELQQGQKDWHLLSGNQRYSWLPAETALGMKGIKVLLSRPG